MLLSVVGERPASVLQNQLAAAFLAIGSIYFFQSRLGCLSLALFVIPHYLSWLSIPQGADYFCPALLTCLNPLF